MSASAIHVRRARTLSPMIAASGISGITSGLLFPSNRSEVGWRFAFVAGIVVSMVNYERRHLTTGSIVVPGYIAVFLLQPAVLESMRDGFRGPLALLTTELEDPSGYGRILRDPGGNIIGVVEHHEAGPEQHRIREVNTGIIMARAENLRRWLDRIGCDNAKGEYYLPDIFALARAEDGEIQGFLADDPQDLEGANDRAQLAALERRYQAREAARLMAQGVQLMDPARG